MSDKTEVRLAGFGGQGIVLAGNILGRAATLFEGQNAVFPQSYGPEARGGACTADVVISAGRVNYPKVIAPRILVLMSEDAKNTYGHIYAEGATILTDQDLVRLEEPPPGGELHRIPATRLAEELGRVIVANIVMLGFLTSVTGVVSQDSMRQAILSSIPKGTEELNLKAFETGYGYGRKEKGP
ncbi:MAG: 2-oxoacid:acceptor oxidoreductase family protein [Proteobacteria bacterium]|nr:2-oxoacid:acceptor oxidoreductase family protein [Pseudomonadota bacterium]MBU1741179.1 2-oxoacid:acceptor oxidoreductase family protein [Pseudomonadota bacterium]